MSDRDHNRRTRCAVVSLGCPKNLVDSEVMLGLLDDADYAITADCDQADVVIVNTCGFLRAAEEESLEAVREAVAAKRNGQGPKVVMTGCLVQRRCAALQAQLPEVDGFVAASEVLRIVEAVRDAERGRRPVHISNGTAIYDPDTPRIVSTQPWTAYLKIAEGCNHPCTFCTIPALRGAFASRPMEDILAEAEALASQGVRELVLLAQDSTHYGLDIYRRARLADLVRQLADIEGVDWVRVLYAYPTHISDELLEVMDSHDNVCRYLDVPLQHADSEVLRCMRRPGDERYNRELVQRLRAGVRDIALRTAFIVGFPGETEKQFATLLRFVEEMEFDHLAAFEYSQETDTPAGSMPAQTSAETRTERYHRLMSLQQTVSRRVNARWVGRELDVLVESVDEAEGAARGRSYRDAPEVDGEVVFPATRAVRPGDIVRVRVNGSEPYELRGRIASRRQDCTGST